MTMWFSGMLGATTRCKELLLMWVLAGSGYGFDQFMKVVERVVFAEFTCILALGGSIMGIIAGAMSGHTTEAGFLDGACKGAVTGAIAAIELLNNAATDETLSMVALFRSLFNGKLFIEWICPAVAQAYQCHMNAHGTTYTEESDIYNGIFREVTAKGMAWNIIPDLPVQPFVLDFEDEEFMRSLPNCGHFFHLVCIDKWLVQQGSCPICRVYVPNF